jgi:hypothetical protein
MAPGVALARRAIKSRARGPGNSVFISGNESRNGTVSSFAASSWNVFV